MADRPCVIGSCRCGGFGVVHDAQAEAETGVCHQSLPPVELDADAVMYMARAKRLRETAPAPACAWCYGEALIGSQEDAGRPLTDDEAAAGFWAVHSECRSKLDAMFVDLAARGVFVDVRSAD